MTQQQPDIDGRPVETSGLADLAVDVWRIRRRAVRDGATEAVRIACERAVERFTDLGLQMTEFAIGEPYDENLVVRVVHREEGGSNARIVECLSPAIYFHGKLVRPAEVVIEGVEENGTSDR
jgi:hypothetical protein